MIGLAAGVMTLVAPISAVADAPATDVPETVLEAAVEIVEASVVATMEAQATGTDWVAKAADSICGVSTARQITNPAKVDYDELLEATSEMIELKREKIEKTSARGQALVTKATQKVRDAAKKVMTEKGHCSVWKKISNKQGVAITDLTSEIKPKLN